MNACGWFAIMSVSILGCIQCSGGTSGDPEVWDRGQFQEETDTNSQLKTDYDRNRGLIITQIWSTNGTLLKLELTSTKPAFSWRISCNPNGTLLSREIRSVKNGVETMRFKDIRLYGDEWECLTGTCTILPQTPSHFCEIFSDRKKSPLESKLYLEHIEAVGEALEKNEH